MTSLGVIVTSRERSHTLRRLVDAWDATRTTAEMLLVVDRSDPTLDDYVVSRSWLPEWVHFETVRGGSHGAAMNEGMEIALSREYEWIGSFNDDHVPRTRGWDELLTTTDAPLAYPDDGFQGERLATAVVASAALLRDLGYVAPPGLDHMYIDDFWMELGRVVGIEYVPAAVVEHVHPDAGKAETDHRYEAVGSVEAYARDRAWYNRFLLNVWPAGRDRLRDAGWTSR